MYEMSTFPNFLVKIINDQEAINFCAKIITRFFFSIKTHKKAEVTVDFYSKFLGLCYVVMGRKLLSRLAPELSLYCSIIC